MVYGSADLVHTLLNHNFIDEYRLLVYPLVRGYEKRLFGNESTTTLQLVGKETFSSGIIALLDRPAQRA